MVPGLRASSWRTRSIDLGVVLDCVLAVLLTVGVLVDAGAVSGRRMGAVAVLACAALTGGVALRRRSAVLAVVLAAFGLVAFERASGYSGDGAFEGAAIAACLYMLGRRAWGRPAVAWIVALSLWLGASVLAGLSEPGGAVGNSLFWALCGVLPFAVAFVLAGRAEAASQLEVAAQRLQREKAERARHAAEEERGRIARDLHDVVAHCLSVMVVQTSGARRVATADPEAAGRALKVVESSGRAALAELRRIVGVLCRDDGQPAGASPGLRELPVLAEQAREAGLPVELCVEGSHRSLSPGLELAAYRIVQESLTNAIKHAGPASARIHVVLGAGHLEVTISDTGRGRGQRRSSDGSGHGLIGMSERVRLYGGDLYTGAGADGGFEVRARIPIDHGHSVPQEPANSKVDRPSPFVVRGGAIAGRWLDAALASGFLVALELTALAGSEQGTVRLRDMLILALMAIACLWRRRYPLWFLVVVVALVFPLSRNVKPSSSFITAVYVGLLPAYTVAAWEDRERARLGLAIAIVASAVGGLLVSHIGVANYAASLFTICAAWAVGRAIRARRSINQGLELAASRLTAEGEDRARLAIAGERSRIARELHAVVARSVAAMVVQVEAARSLLDRDPTAADTALAAVEEVGREALGEMRRILGVLRQRDDDGALLEPQPGVAQIHRLIERARERGQQVEASIAGEPGALSAGVDLGVYRIVEDALASVRARSDAAVRIALRFADDALELQLTTTRHEAKVWPTDAMSQRVLSCGGHLSSDLVEPDHARLTAHLPRGVQEVLA